MHSSIMLEEFLENLSDFTKLREHVSKVTMRELRQEVSDALVEGSSDPHTVLHAVLTALQSRTEDADLDDKLLHVFVTTARVVAEQQVTARSAQEMISSLESHVAFLRPTESCELFQHLVGVVQNSVPKNPKVFELLPSLLAHLDATEADVGSVDLPCTDMDDSDNEKENKKCSKGASPLEVLCETTWNVGNILGLASAFSDASMPPRQRETLIRTLTSRLKDLPLTDLPALVHQIVLIAAKNDPKAALHQVFAFLTESDARAAETSKQASESVDIICSGPDPLLLGQAEGTVLLHFLYGVKQNQELGKNILKVIKSFGPHQSLEPFLLGLQLTLCDVHTFEEQFLENARSSIAAAFRVNAKFYQSAWIRGLTAAPANVDELVLRTVENCCDGRWDCVCPGLLKLALGLLDAAVPKGGALALARSPVVSGLTLDPISARLTQLAHRILRLMFKRIAGARADLLEAVVARMVAHAQKPTWSVYTGLLQRLVAQFPQLCLEHARCLARPLDYVSLLAPGLARSYIHAILPLLRSEQSVRNQLMIVLRKALFLRQRESRGVGVSGLLLLLQHLRVVGSLSTQSSLSSQEGNFVCSQAQVHLPGSSSLTNDSLCSELLSLLRRCVDQQDALQRANIYAGLVEVLPRNKQLAVAVVSLLKARFDAVFEEDEEVQPPLKVDAAAADGDDGEPLAVLVSRLGRAVRYCQTELLDSDILDETQSAQSQLSRLCQEARTGLRSVVRRMGRLDTDDVGIRSANVSNSSQAPDRSGRQTAVASLLIDMYDALMEFELHEEKGKITEDFVRLFTKQELFRKAVKENSTTASKSKRRPNPAPSPSPLPDVFSLKNLQVAVSRCLSLWAGEEEEEEVVDTEARSKLLQHLLTTAIEAVRRMMKNTSQFASKDEETVRHLAKMAGVCLRHFVADLARMAEDDSTALGKAVMGAALDLFVCVMNGLMEKGEEQVDKAVEMFELDSEDGGKTTVGALVKQLKTCCESLLSEPSDSAFQRHLVSLLPLMVALCRHRVAEHLDWLSGLCDWLADQLRTETTGRQRLDNASVRAVLSEALSVARLAKPGNCLLREVACDLHCRLGDVDQNTTLQETTEFSAVTSRNAGPLVHLLTSQLERALDDCDWLLSRLKLAWPHEARKGKLRSDAVDILDMQERALCLRLGYLCNALNELVQSAVSPGPQADCVTSCLTRLYTCLGSLAKHYLQLLKDGHGKFSPKFEKLVRLSGSCLSPHSYAFISYVQTTELQKARTTADGKSQKKKKQLAGISLNKTAGKKMTEPSGVKLSRSMKDSRVLPNLIFAIEQYERFLIQLSKRSKTDLMQHVKMSTARDFRINQSAVQQALSRDNLSSDEDEVVEVPSQAPSQPVRTELSFGEASMRNSQSQAVEESEEPPAKARRLGSRGLQRS